MISPRYDSSVEFLKRWRPKGPWVLSAIALDKKQQGSVITRTFTKAAEVLSWLELMGEDRNLYFSVNPTKEAVSKKPSREDVASMDWLHVDIDPRVPDQPPANATPDDAARLMFEHNTRERERILSMLRNPPGEIPPPTAIVFSGGGYQGFWKLMEPMDIDGEESNYDEAKRYNLSLELAFGADPCHNVDRIMRLPGTLNRPDAKKKKKGRKIALAKTVEWDDDRTYAISTFRPAPEVQSAKTGFGSTNRVKVSGNISRIDDINTVGDKVSDLCKVVIVQGTDPDDPTRFESRSEAVFFVACELVRADIDDDTIYSILTDPDFRISDSILEKSGNAESYAVRQIERAREHAIDPQLQKMNENYAVVMFGGKMRVIYERYDSAIKRYKLVRMTFEDFAQKFRNQRVDIGIDNNGNPRSIPLGKWWLDHPSRREYESVTFAPGEETPDEYNMWRGFAMAPVVGDKHEAFLTHVRNNICGADPELYDYVVGWMARCIQKPGEPGHTAIVLRGDQGVGKGFFANTLGRLFGRHYLAVSNAQHLTGNFNSHLRDCVVLFADEAFYAGDKRHGSTLKTLVTEPELLIEAKGVDSETSNNCLHLIMASNEEWVVPAGPNERRFCLLDVGSAHMQDSNYFGRIAAGLRDGGHAHLLNFLLTYDISKYDVRKLPQTAGLRDQKVRSFDAFQEWWYGKLKDGRLLGEHEDWQQEIAVEDLKVDYFEQMKLENVQRRGTSTRLQAFLEKACPGLSRIQARESLNIGGRLIKRPYVYQFPSLEKLRKHWDSKFGGPYPWPENLEVRDGGVKNNKKKDPF